ncbi:pilin [Arenimonas sp.]|uniref:pilin n=1 Tax=Arenimonas sp. TaxID=1872635 RepID=UPI0039E3CB22
MDASSWFYVDRNGQRQGPVTAHAIREAYRQRSIDGETLIWREGMSDWLALRQFEIEFDLDDLDVVAEPPPVPTAAPTAIPAAMPPPAKKGNGCLLIGIILLVGAIVLMAILAAIAIPQYQEYVARAQAAEAMALGNSLKPSIEQAHAQNGVCPTNGSEGFGPPASYAGRYVGNVRLGVLPNGSCAVQVQFGDQATQAIRGRSIVLEAMPGEPGAMSWTCSGPDMPPKLLPSGCR